jgi:hypothetical protein
MGIIQASSTMTDYMVAFWMVCVGSEVLEMHKRGPTRTLAIFASLAAGLALLSKPTAAAYILPFAFLAASTLLRRSSRIQAMRWATLATFLFLVVNAGHLVRNFALYGNPIGGTARIAEHANQLFNPQGMFSNVLRNAALHTGTPKGAINEMLFSLNQDVHRLIGVDINDPRTTAVGPFRPIGGFATHEDVTGNLLHSLLILVAFSLALLKWKELGSISGVYALSVAATFFLFSLLFKWQIFGSRYHLPFFVLFTPLIGFVFGQLFQKNSLRAMGALLLIASIPWLISIDSRPLVPRANDSPIGSILTEPRERLYFGNNLSLIQPYGNIVNQIKGSNCFEVGLAIAGGAAEYPLWVLLGAPSPSLQVEWIVQRDAFGST